MTTNNEESQSAYPSCSGEENETGEMWFYEEDGKRKGPVTRPELLSLIENGSVTYGDRLWNNSLADWTEVENTNFLPELQKISPPPLPREKINNACVWFIAIFPLIGEILEFAISSLSVGSFLDDFGWWKIYLIFNIVGSTTDVRVLQKAGYDTGKFKGWCWLVPVYLYKRAKYLKHSLAYFITWWVCLLIPILWG